MTTITLSEWTTDKPNVPGLYRFRGECPGFWLGKAEYPVWCEVWFHIKPRVGMVSFFAKQPGAHLDEMTGEWQGPIVIDGVQP